MSQISDLIKLFPLRCQSDVAQRLSNRNPVLIEENDVKDTLVFRWADGVHFETKKITSSGKRLFKLQAAYQTVAAALTAGGIDHRYAQAEDIVFWKNFLGVAG